MTAFVGLGVVLALGAAGLLGWRALAPGLRRLQPGDTAPQGFWLWLVGFAVFIVAGSLAVFLVQPSPPDTLPISRSMPLQALASLLAVGVMLLIAARRRIGRDTLGLRSHRGPSAVAVAVCAWLAFYPVFLLVALANAELNALFGNDLELQGHMQAFLADERARHSPLIWAIMVLVLPACEELLFRGALHGGLRRLLHPAAAVGVSALIFALVHGNPATVLLPVTALGVALALLYERTGSLTAPILFHALHNGLTLAAAALFPEILDSP